MNGLRESVCIILYFLSTNLNVIVAFTLTIMLVGNQNIHLINYMNANYYYYLLNYTIIFDVFLNRVI
jgi:hypothetical protein